MPWTPKDASAHTKKANTPAKAKQWSAVADKVLSQSGDDASAIKIANAAVKNHPSKGKPGHWSKR